MIHYRALTAEQKLEHRTCFVEFQATADRCKAITSSGTNQNMDDGELDSEGGGQQLGWKTYPHQSTSATWLDTILHSEQDPNNVEASQCTSVAQESSQTPCCDNFSSTASRRVINYEDSSVHEERHMRIVAAKVATFHQIGDGVDPFNVLPLFDHPELNSLYLLRKCW